MTAEVWIELLKNFGVPVVALAFVGLCIWKLGHWVTSDSGPWGRVCDWINKATTAHLDFVEHVKRQGDQQTGTLADAKQLLADHDGRAKDNCRLVRNLHAGAMEACDSLEEMLDNGPYSPTAAKEAISRVRAALDQHD